MRFLDAVPVAGTRRTADGYLIADAKAVRTGIQTYLGAEVGRPDLAQVRVYRSEAEVRDANSLQSFSHAPITMGHPSDAVTAENWKDLAVGEVSTAATWDGHRISLPLILKDAAAIEATVAGRRELSAGYTCDLDWMPGMTADGQDFDAQQRNIRANHVAIVDRGRAGPECRIGDAAPAWGAAPLSPAPQLQRDALTMKTHLVDGHPVEMSDAAIIAVSGLQKTLANTLADNLTMSTAITTKDAAIAAKEEEIGRLKTELQAAKDSAPKPEQLDRLVADRAALVTVVKTLDSRIVTDGKTDAELRRAAVAAKHGDDFVKDASDAEIIGMFKAVAKDAKPDPLAATLAGGIQQHDSATTVGDAYASMCSNLTDGWKAASSQKAA